jgi:hypothetical protein
MISSICAGLGSAVVAPERHAENRSRAETNVRIEPSTFFILARLQDGKWLSRHDVIYRDLGLKFQLVPLIVLTSGIALAAAAPPAPAHPDYDHVRTLLENLKPATPDVVIYYASRPAPQDAVQLGKLVGETP